MLPLLIGRVRLAVRSPLDIWETCDALLQRLDAFEATQIEFEGQRASFVIGGEVIANSRNDAFGFVSSGRVTVEPALNGATIRFDLSAHWMLLAGLAFSLVAGLVGERSGPFAAALSLLISVWIVAGIVARFAGIVPRRGGPSPSGSSWAGWVLGLIAFLFLGWGWVASASGSSQADDDPAFQWLGLFMLFVVALIEVGRALWALNETRRG